MEIVNALSDASTRTVSLFSELMERPYHASIPPYTGTRTAQLPVARLPAASRTEAVNAKIAV